MIQFVWYGGSTKPDRGAIVMKPDDSSSSDSSSSVNRRHFFRQMLVRGIERLEETGKAMQERYDGAFEKPKEEPLSGIHHPQPMPDRFLRPPGALPEYEFAAICTREGKCVEVCPADAIKIEPDKGGGLPHIVARTAPCVVCESLACMKECPSGALQDVGRPDHIMMGYAVISHDTCLRSKDEDCTLCVDPCPVGETAIRIGEAGRLEVQPGCIGCGVCERACPTEPTSIWVEPQDAGLGYYDHSYSD